MKIIYDVGANNGDNIPYYLLKSDLVVAIEANPDLCNHIKKRFEKEISAKKLIILNFIISNEKNNDVKDFFIHKKDHVLSRSMQPTKENLNNFKKIKVQSKYVLDIIKEFGDPYYIKIDIEHSDHLILRELFLSKIQPPYISAEVHTFKIFSLLSVLGEYESFKTVMGEQVSKRYKNHEIDTKNGKKNYSFPHHSAGPFGNDIEGPWLTADNFFITMCYMQRDWFDIHCSRVDSADPLYIPKSKFKVFTKDKKEIHLPESVLKIFSDI